MSIVIQAHFAPLYASITKPTPQNNNSSAISSTPGGAGAEKSPRGSKSANEEGSSAPWCCMEGFRATPTRSPPCSSANRSAVPPSRLSASLMKHRRGSKPMSIAARAVRAAPSTFSAPELSPRCSRSRPEAVGSTPSSLTIVV